MESLASPEQLPNLQELLKRARNELVEEWRSKDPNRSETTTSPRRLFSKKNELGAQWIIIKGRIEIAYDSTMAKLYERWLQEHNSRPFLYSPEHNERKLAKWASRNIETIKQFKRPPFDYPREYREWIYRHRKPPSGKSEKVHEARLARWAVAVQVKSQKGELTEEISQSINSILGENWLGSAPFLKVQ